MGLVDEYNRVEAGKRLASSEANVESAINQINLDMAAIVAIKTESYPGDSVEIDAVITGLKAKLKIEVTDVY